MLPSSVIFVETHTGWESHETEAARLSLDSQVSKPEMHRKSAFVLGH